MSERVTPYHIIFEAPGIAGEFFPRIAHELEAKGEFTRDAFFSTGGVNELLGEIASGPGEGSARIALLAYHAFCYWREGEQQWSLDEAALQELVQLPRIGGWPLEVPSPAGYIQLPRHRIFVPGGDDPAEPLDGFFWVRSPDALNVLDVLLVLGVHAGRPGVTVVELSSGPLPPEGHWGDIQAREGGEDFANVLPGGDQLLGLSTAGEVLKLASRTFWQLQAHGSVRDRAGSGGDR